MFCWLTRPFLRVTLFQFHKKRYKVITFDINAKYLCMKSFSKKIIAKNTSLKQVKKTIIKVISQTIKGEHRDIRSSDTPPSPNPNHQSKKQALPHCFNSQTSSFKKKQDFSLDPFVPQPV